MLIILRKQQIIVINKFEWKDDWDRSFSQISSEKFTNFNIV